MSDEAVPTTEMAEARLTISIIELTGGGYVIADEPDYGRSSFIPFRAVTTLSEAKDTVHARMMQWQKEVVALKQAGQEDEHPEVSYPNRFWRRVR